MITRPLLACVVFVPILCLLLLPAPDALAGGPYMRGPMVGHVSQTTAVIWVYTRNRPGVRVYFRPRSAPRSEARFVDMGTYTVGPKMARVTLEGLRPDTPYVYRVFFRGKTEAGWEGRFKTAPPVGAPSVFTMAVSSCMKYDHERQGSWTLMLNEKPDFHLLLGDNVYADTSNRAKLFSDYMKMRRVAPFHALLRVTPTYAMWDDHDYAGDNLGVEVKLKDQSLQAFKEVWANPSAGLPEVPGTFFKLSRGDVDFFVLDGRYYRSRLEARNDNRKRMLGDAQFRWLARGLKASKARFKVICTGSTIQIEGEDTWVNYRFALMRIYHLIRDARIGGVLWVSGDLHRSLIDVHPKSETTFYDLNEVISSGIANSDDNSFATLKFDTTVPDPTVHIRIHHGNGSITEEKTLKASALQVSAP